MRSNLFDFGEFEGQDRCTSRPTHMGLLPVSPEAKHFPVLTNLSTAPAADRMRPGGTHSSFRGATALYRVGRAACNIISPRNGQRSRVG